MRRAILAATLPALAAALPGLAAAQSAMQGSDPIQQGAKNVPDFQPAFEGQTRAPAVQSSTQLQTEEIASGLTHPWGLAILPHGAYLVTERSGQLRVITREGDVSDPVEGVPEVVAQRQGGLLDVALAEDFGDSRVIFLTYSKPVDGGSATAAARAVLSEDRTSLSEVEDVFVQQPASEVTAHYGSRVTPQNGRLWITTGEHFTEANRLLAQDLDATYGKIIRINTDGSIPEDNPFAGQEDALTEIWSLGHRNVQGDAVDRDGRYWTLEHGPQGGDELNLPKGGMNYGWPVVSYGQNYDGSAVGSGAAQAPEMAEPVYYWDPVIAPGDMVFYEGEAFPEWDGSLLIASLTPGGLNRLVIEGEKVTGEEKLLPDLGRVRDVAVDTDGTLLVLTDEDNGALIRVTP